LLNVGSGSAVCKYLKNLTEKLDGDQDLRRRVEQAEAQLNASRRSRGKESAREKT
jgi:hypothetical protein